MTLRCGATLYGRKNKFEEEITVPTYSALLPGAIKVEDNCAHGSGVQKRDKGQAVVWEFTGLLAGGSHRTKTIKGDYGELEESQGKDPGKRTQNRGGIGKARTAHSYRTEGRGAFTRGCVVKIKDHREVICDVRCL